MGWGKRREEKKWEGRGCHRGQADSGILGHSPPGEPEGTPDWSASALERTLHPRQHRSMPTLEHLLRVPAPLLSAPHHAANSLLECWSILPLLLPIHLPCPCSCCILPGTPAGRKGAHATLYHSFGDIWLLTISNSLKDGPQP